ncbi:MAG: phosphatidylglycerol lysyltransferase domain-containing protein [Gammaproteobacteria bacterium]|nr:phosphatidylglycerol lysyltransferase domain-containing protein [Gammaproteobacteria bacterium]
MALLTFCAGAVLLASAAFPGVAGRLALLREYLPLPAVEGAHLLSVSAGVALLALARGIAGRVRGAYRLALPLLLAGALFTFLKGLDYEEALFLLGVAALLHLQRGRFDRHSYPLLSRRSLLWTAAAIAGLTAYAALTLRLNGAHFLRPLAAAVIGFLGLLGWAWFRLPRPALSLPAADELDAARRLIRTHGGNRFAHILFSGDKYLFHGRDERALIQYAPVRGSLVALGDPLGDADRFPGLVLEFRDFADRYDLNSVFYEVSERHLHLYHDAGLALFKLGEAARVPVAGFTLAGRRHGSLRSSVNRARGEGARFELLQPPFAEATWAGLEQVSRAWLADRHGHEQGFSLGRFERGYLELGPVAVITAADRIAAFASLGRDYGGREALAFDLMRLSPTAPPGVMELLLVELIGVAGQQGYRYLDLGVAPLSGVGRNRFARRGERMARLLYDHGNQFYAYQGLRRFKQKFDPVWEGVYLAYPPLAPLPGLLLDVSALIAGGYRRVLLRGS